MADKPNKAHVDVTLEGDNPVKFTLSSKDLPIKDGVLYFNNNGRPGFQIYFNLLDPNGLGYRFPPNYLKDDAIRSELGSTSKCPSHASGKNDVFEVSHVEEPSRTTLVVKNGNQKKDQLGAFGFALFVTKDDGRPYLPLDPGGWNNNGSTSAAKTLTLALAAGAAAGVVITLGAQALLAG